MGPFVQFQKKIAGHISCSEDDVESGHAGRSESCEMPTVDERVVELETRILPELRDEMRRGFADIAQRFDQMEKRFDVRFNQVDTRLERLDTRVERLDDRADRHLRWVVGVQFTTMIRLLRAVGTVI